MGPRQTTMDYAHKRTPKNAIIPFCLPKVKSYIYNGDNNQVLFNFKTRFDLIIHTKASDGRLNWYVLQILSQKLFNIYIWYTIQRFFNRNSNLIKLKILNPKIGKLSFSKKSNSLTVAPNFERRQHQNFAIPHFGASPRETQKNFCFCKIETCLHV